MRQTRNRVCCCPKAGVLAAGIPGRASKSFRTLETPPGATANLVFPVLGLVMLVLSLQVRRAPEAGA